MGATFGGGAGAALGGGVGATLGGGEGFGLGVGGGGVTRVGLAEATSGRPATMFGSVDARPGVRSQEGFPPLAHVLRLY